jgi:hypothetical protein
MEQSKQMEGSTPKDDRDGGGGETRATHRHTPSCELTIRLLLHADNGLVPYLTPQLLRETFPVVQFGSRLWMGLAVKDTCVVPAWNKRDESPTPHSSNNSNRSSNSNNNSNSSNKTTPPKPRGYVFADHVQADAWMTPYTRVTVPTFDLVADTTSRQPQHAAAASKDVVATDEQVLLWTGHGRQALTPAVYFRCTQGLDSYANLPLFDACWPHDAPSKAKRRAAAVRRTQAWTTDFQQRRHAATVVTGTSATTFTAGTPLLVPIVVDAQLPDTSVDEQLEHVVVQQQSQHVTTHPRDGIALIGWADLPPDRQTPCLAAVRRAVSPVACVAVLTTHNLRQVLLAACHGVNLVGSRLPQDLALAKRALVLDVASWVAGFAVLSKDDNDDNDDPAPRDDNNNHHRTLPLDANGALDLHPPRNAQGQERVEQHPYVRDPRPLLPGCACYTCRTHSRAYVYHLVCAQELLAEVLLFVHNLYHLLFLLETVEQLREQSRQVDLLEWVASRCRGGEE